MLVFGAIAPHGGDTIAEIADNPRVMAKTRAGMQELGRRFVRANPETVVVLNPHGAIVEDAISIGVGEVAFGVLGDDKRQVQTAFATDLAFIQDIARAANAEATQYSSSIPLIGIRGKQSRGSAESIVWLDWGALVPLWFTAHTMEPRPKVVVIAPNRSLPRETLVRCGVAIARAAEASGKRVALIASCDQGHAHDADGPYGYAPDSAIHDEAMCQAIRDNDLDRLLGWPEAFLEDAKVDAYWQTIMLAGAIGHTPMRGELISYEAPTYFGMAVAAYTPVE